MKINDNKKVDILLNLLSERYNASHKMRERSLNFTTWILGFGIALSWILLSQITLNFTQRIVFTIFIIVIGSFTIIFLSSIEIGFNNNRKVMIRIEKILGCYELNEYSDDETLFPEVYKSFNKKRTWHFRSLYIGILLIFILLIVFIWLEPICIAIKHLCK